MVAFVASTVLTAANLNTAFNALTIRTVTGTSDTLLLADNGGAVTYSNASATTSTIPPNSSVAYAVGTKIVLANLGAGVVTVTAGAGVTVNGTLTIAQNAGGTCLKTATNTWSFLPFGSAGAATLTSADVTSTTGSPTITTSGANTIYSFTGSGTIVLGKAGLCTVLGVGAGGGGGLGGGGAGGLIDGVGLYLPSGTNTVTVGAGGSGSINSGEAGRNGTSSFVAKYVFVGGGFGGGVPDVGGPTRGGTGGSAGGSYQILTVSTSIAGQGNDGGTGTGSGGGGGGGAGAVGGNAAGAVGGAGGAGSANSITGSSITYAGGGGAFGSTTPGGGGAGGGAAGKSIGTGNAGSANLGGGGGGTNSATAGAGGSGVVIISVTT